jgi:hypothetical protein
VFVFYAPPFEQDFVRREAFVEYLQARGVPYQVDFVLDRHGETMFYLYFPERLAFDLYAMDETMALIALYPPSVRRGELPNPQPDGMGAIAVKAQSLQPGDDYLIMFGGRARTTTRGQDGILTASLDIGDVLSVGEYEVVVVNVKKWERSNSLVFTVLHND